MGHVGGTSRKDLRHLGTCNIQGQLTRDHHSASVFHLCLFANNIYTFIELVFFTSPHQLLRLYLHLQVLIPTRRGLFYGNRFCLIKKPEKKEIPLLNLLHVPA